MKHEYSGRASTAQGLQAGEAAADREPDVVYRVAMRERFPGGWRSKVVEVTVPAVDQYAFRQNHDEVARRLASPSATISRVLSIHRL